ncbi:hypothetical protein ACM66B_004110 [Microbotryomycetes sp. NB124-2]
MPRARKRARDDVSSDESFKMDGADETDELASSGVDEGEDGVVGSAAGANSAASTSAGPSKTTTHTSTKRRRRRTSSSSQSEYEDSQDDEPMTKEQDVVYKRKVRLFYAAKPSRERIGALRKVAEERRDAYKAALAKTDYAPATGYERKTERRFRIFEGDTSLRYEFSKDLPLVHESNVWLKLWREQFEWDHKWARFSTLVGVACKLLEDGDWPTEKEFDKALNKKRRRKPKRAAASGLEPIKNPADVSVQHVSGHQLPLISNTVDCFFNTRTLYVSITVIQAEIRQEGRVALYISFGAKVLGRKFLLTSTTTHFRPQDPSSAEFGAWEGLCNLFLDNPAAVVHGTIELMPWGEFQLNMDELGFFSLSGLSQQSKDKIKWMLETLETLIAPLRSHKGQFYLCKEWDGLWRLKKGPDVKKSSTLYPLKPQYTDLTSVKKEYKPPGRPPAILKKLDPSLTAGIVKTNDATAEQSAEAGNAEAGPSDAVTAHALGAAPRASEQSAPAGSVEQAEASAGTNETRTPLSIQEDVDMVDAAELPRHSRSRSRNVTSPAKSVTHQANEQAERSLTPQSGRPKRNAVLIKPVDYHKLNVGDGDESSEASAEEQHGGSNGGAATESEDDVLPQPSRRLAGKGKGKAVERQSAKGATFDNGSVKGGKQLEQRQATESEPFDEAVIDANKIAAIVESSVDVEMATPATNSTTATTTKGKRALRKSAPPPVTRAPPPKRSSRASAAAEAPKPATTTKTRAPRRSAPELERPTEVEPEVESSASGALGFAPPPPASFFRSNAVLSPFKTSTVAREPGSMLLDFETGKRIEKQV